MGDNCVKVMLDDIIKKSDDSVVCLLGYNSSRFDNIFLIPELLKLDMLDDVFFQKIAS